MHYSVIAFVSQNMEETAERKGMWYYCQVKLGFNECLYCGDWCSTTILAIEWVIILLFLNPSLLIAEGMLSLGGCLMLRLLGGVVIGCC